MMAKTFMLNVDNLSSNEDEKKIRDYFETNLDGVEKLDINLSLKLISVHYVYSVLLSPFTYSII